MKNSSFLSIFAALLIFISCQPYFTWGWFSDYRIIFAIRVFFACVVAYNIDLKTHGRIWIFLILLLTFSFHPIKSGSNINGIMLMALLAFVPFAKEKFSYKIYDVFLTIYSAVIGISCVFYILSLFNMAPLIGTIMPLNEGKPYNYLVFPLLVKPSIASGFYRFCGPFDEPGVVGTLSALILCISHLNVKDKRIIIVLVSGLLSFSFFFYSVLLVLIFFGITFMNKKRTSLLVVCLLLLMLSYNNEFMYNILWKRFEWDSSTEMFAGDNRIGEQGKDLFLSIIGTNEFFWGYSDYDNFYEKNSWSASYIFVIMQYGFVFFFCFLISFIAFAWQYKAKLLNFLLFILVFFATIYQRPFIFDLNYLFLFSMLALTNGYIPSKRVYEMEKKYNK